MAAVEPEVADRNSAFEQLYERYVGDVYRYTLAVLRNPADAEDVTQTTFLNAYRAYLRGDEPRLPQNWLLRIAHNVCRTRYARSSRRPQEVPLEDRVNELVVPEQDLPNVRGVLKALGRLPFNQRSALAMRELEGRSYQEIAETLGVSVSAVETLIFRARRSLRLRATALKALGAVQLPGSLSSFLGSGELAAGGGTLIGSGLLAKAALLLVAGAVSAGVGYKAAQVVGHQEAARATPQAARGPAQLLSGGAGQRGSGAATESEARRAGRGFARGVVDSPSLRFQGGGAVADGVQAETSVDPGGGPSAGPGGVSSPASGAAAGQQPGSSDAVALVTSSAVAPSASQTTSATTPPLQTSVPTTAVVPTSTAVPTVPLLTTVQTPSLPVQTTVPTVTVPPPPTLP
jgi:RNA polymerase sigma factor (sigma-70 family)